MHQQKILVAERAKNRLKTDFSSDAVKVVIDCLIDNHSKRNLTPVVLVFNDENGVKEIFRRAFEYWSENYPGSIFRLDYQHLDLSNNKDLTESYIQFTKALLLKPTMFFWSKNSREFKYLPDGLLHVVKIGKDGTVERGFNRQCRLMHKVDKTKPRNNYMQMFDDVRHWNQEAISDQDKANWAFLLECDAKIIRPIPTCADSEFDKVITKDSSGWQILAFLQLQRYAMSECNLESIADLKHGLDYQTRIYPFILQVNGVGSQRMAMVGAVAIKVSAGNATLNFAWIHPAYRGKGLMKAKWKDLMLMYGDVQVDRPNAAMLNFLTAVGHRQGSLRFNGGVNPLM